MTQRGMIKRIGRICAAYRKDHNYEQKDAAKDTGYSLENISSFENGRNDNVRIFLWYVSKGLNMQEIGELLYENKPDS